MSNSNSNVAEGGEQTIQFSYEEKEQLLRTKLYIPPLRSNCVARPRLIKQINHSLEMILTLITAPAGYGKTTLVSSWLRQTDVSSTWLSLDEGDNDPVCFLQYFITALQKIIPAGQSSLLGVLQGMHSTPLDVLLNIIINEIAGHAVPLVLVIDDFQTIHAQPVLEMITYLIEHAPPQMHLMLISRIDPSLPISRLRARNQLLEIRAEQLRFTNEEIAIFLTEMMGLKLTADDIAAVEARTEGWIAGLQLAALSMQGCKDIHSFVAEFTGSHYYIMDYLTEEVLKLQPDRVRLFLLQTSILTSMCASLCEAVVDKEEIEQVNGQAMLETLEQMNLFVIPLDDRRQWHRYHHLFADILNLRLEKMFPQQIPELHRRASHWYEKNDIISEATYHAVMAGDQAHAAHLVEQHGCSLLMSGEGFTLLKWIEAIESYSQTNPWLAVLKAWALALTGHLDQVEPSLQTVEGQISSHEQTFEVKIILGSIAAVRAYLANQQGETHLAADYAQGALEYLPDSNVFSCSLRSVAVSILGDASWMNGNLGEARGAYIEAVQISQTANNSYMTLIANTNLADVMMEQGDLHQAARVYIETLQMATRPDGRKLPLADRIYAGLSKLSYQWNHLDKAAQYVQQCIELCQQWGNSNLLSKGYVLLAWVELAKGNPDKAQAAIRAAEQMAYAGSLSSRQSTWVKVACARWWIKQGNLERALQLVQQTDVVIDGYIQSPQIPPRQEDEFLLLLRLQLARGDQEAALLLSESLVQKAEAGMRMGQVIEILVLQALAFQGRKDVDRALDVLGRALTLAQPEGYSRVFLDEGEPMVKLLFQAKARRICSEYSSKLLSELGEASTTELPANRLLIEPLTLRELEVLKLIKAGNSNQDIADKLVISIPTVKRHLSNIYAKLGVESRTQAVSLGSELRLFD